MNIYTIFFIHCLIVSHNSCQCTMILSMCKAIGFTLSCFLLGVHLKLLLLINGGEVTLFSSLAFPQFWDQTLGTYLHAKVQRYPHPFSKPCLCISFLLWDHVVLSHVERETPFALEVAWALLCLKTQKVRGAEGAREANLFWNFWEKVWVEKRSYVLGKQLL